MIVRFELVMIPCSIESTAGVDDWDVEILVWSIFPEDILDVRRLLLLGALQPSATSAWPAGTEIPSLSGFFLH